MQLHSFTRFLLITIGLVPIFGSEASSSASDAEKHDDLRPKRVIQAIPNDNTAKDKKGTKPRKNASPIQAMLREYEANVQKVMPKYSDLSTRLQSMLEDENAKSITGFDPEEQLSKLNQLFADFDKLHNSDEPLGNKRSGLLRLNTACKSCEKEIVHNEKYIKKIVNEQQRKKLTASAEQLLRNQQYDSKNDNTTSEVKALAKKTLQDQKNTTHIKLTRPGAKGPNARDHDEQRAAHAENKTKVRPYKDVVFEKSVKGQVPHAAMDTVVLIRNIIRKSKNKEQILAELGKFEKDIDLKEVNPNYVGLPANEVDTVYQMRINGQYRAVVAFTKGIYQAPDGREINTDLLYKNTFWVCDPHK